MSLTMRKKRLLVQNQLKSKALEGLKQVAAANISRVLSDNNTPVYVLNTNYQEVGDRGAARTALVFSLTGPNGIEAPLVIPATWVPWCVTAAAHKESVVRSNDFRQAIMAEEIILLEPATAEKVLESPEAQEELSRVANKLRSRTAPDDYVRAEASKPKGFAASFAKEMPRKFEVSAAEKALSECSGAVRSLIASFPGRKERGDDITKQELIDFLILNGDEMTEADLGLLEEALQNNVPGLLADEDVKASLDDICGQHLS